MRKARDRQLWAVSQASTTYLVLAVDEDDARAAGLPLLLGAHRAWAAEILTVRPASEGEVAAWREVAQARADEGRVLLALRITPLWR